MKQLINILTVFLGIIGCFSAILVCFILFIYPNLDSNVSSPDNASLVPSAAITLEDTPLVSDQPELQPQIEEAASEIFLPEAGFDDEPIKSGTYTIDNIEFWFSDSVINDGTGKWRISSIVSSKDITEYAVDYYNTLFHSDDEIHAITNFSLNTTTSISVLSDGILDVAVHEYVSGEEHDVNTLFSGMLLVEYFININTGEVENILDNRETPDYSTGNSEPDNTSESVLYTMPVEQGTSGTGFTADPYTQSANTYNLYENNSNTYSTPTPQTSTSVSDTVWLSATGAKYHSINNCGQTNPDKAYQVSLDYAISGGYEKCTKCF